MSATASALAFDVVRVDAGLDQPVVDVAAAEEPLELRLGGQPFVVIMRTPGADRDLAAGFLASEQIVADRQEIAAMRYCMAGRDKASTTSTPARTSATRQPDTA